jgi:hypothetical protein
MRKINKVLFFGFICFLPFADFCEKYELFLFTILSNKRDWFWRITKTHVLAGREFPLMGVMLV